MKKIRAISITTTIIDTLFSIALILTIAASIFLLNKVGGYLGDLTSSMTNVDSNSVIDGYKVAAESFMTLLSIFGIAILWVMIFLSGAGILLFIASTITGYIACFRKTLKSHLLEAKVKIISHSIPSIIMIGSIAEGDINVVSIVMAVIFIGIEIGSVYILTSVKKLQEVQSLQDNQVNTP